MKWFFNRLFGDNSSFIVRSKEIEEAKTATIRVEKNVLDKIDELASKANYTRNDFIHKILRDFVNSAEFIENEEDVTKRYFEDLDRLLYSTLNRDMMIGLTEDELGHENKKYILVDYKLSYKQQRLSLTIKRNEDIYHKSFNKIRDIRYNFNGDRVKTWIYMDQVNWRFYLYVDEKLYTSLNYEFHSDKYEH